MLKNLFGVLKSGNKAGEGCCNIKIIPQEEAENNQQQEKKEKQGGCCVESSEKIP